MLFQIFYLFEMESCSVTQSKTGVLWSAVVQSWLTATSASQAQVILMSHNQIAKTTNVYHHAQLIFVFAVEIGFHHVGQAGLKL